MDSKELKLRTKKFASLLPNNKLGNHIEGQLNRSATSTAVNYRAVVLAQSDAAFAAKLSIVIEEVDECYFWIEFALDENIASLETANPLMKEAKELTAIFIASRKTIQNRNRNKK